MSDIEEDFDDQSGDELESELDAELVDDGEGIDDLDDDEIDEIDDEESEEIRVVEEVLSQKEQNARALAIRRALEQRMEQKRLHDELDYLDD